MAGDKRELILDLLARDKSGPAVKSFGKSIKDVGDAADKADDKLGKFTVATDIAGKGADDLGDEADQAARRLSKLDREIALTAAELKVLAASFADTSDAAERLDISKGIRKGENDLRRLTKSKSWLSAVLPDPGPTSVSWVKKLTSALSGQLSGMSELLGNHVGITIGVAAAAALGPTLLSGAAAAITGGIGALGIGAGVALAVAKDPELKQAGADAAKKFIDGLAAAAKSSFGGPIRDALGILGDLGDEVSAQWGKAFGKLGPMLVPFIGQISKFVGDLSGSLAGVASKSGPALDAIGKSIIALGSGIGDALNSIADSGPEASANLLLIAGAAADLIRGFGELIQGASWVSDKLSFLTGILPALKVAYSNTGGSLGTFVDGEQDAAEAASAAAVATHEQISALNGLNKAVRAETDPVFGLLDAEDQLSSAQRDAAKAAKEHGKGSRESDAALRRLAEAAVNVEGKAEDLAGTTNGKLTPSLRATLQAAGLTKGEINRLAAQFRGAKRDGDSFAKAYKANTSVSGTEEAAARVRHVRDLLNQVHSKRVSVSVLVADSQLRKVSNTLNHLGGERALGGPVSKGVPYWVGENGPELVVPEANGRVMSASASRMATGGAAAGGSRMASGTSGSQTIRLELVGQDQIVTMFRYLVRTANLLQDA